MITTDELRALLADNVLRIEFVKKDGTLREMWATLQEEYIETPTYSANSEPAHLTTVWDVQKGGWRRVITEAIQSVEVEDGEVPPLGEAA